MTDPPQWVEGDRSAEFWMPASFDAGAFWLGRFDGRSPWERHPHGDELLHLLDGELEVTVLTDDGASEQIELRPGMVFIVPKGLWHRVASRGGPVRLCGVTGPDTEHSEADDPRESS